MEMVYRSFDRKIFETETECREYEKKLSHDLPKIMMMVKDYCLGEKCPSCLFWNSEYDCCKFSEHNVNYPSNWSNPE